MVIKGSTWSAQVGCGVLGESKHARKYPQIPMHARQAESRASYCLHQLFTVPMKCLSRNEDSEEATFFQSSDRLLRMCKQ